MREKLVGESRIPTDYWVGLGFSKSMPDNAIRERLAANNILHPGYTGPTMTTTFEVCYCFSSKIIQIMVLSSKIYKVLVFLTGFSE